MDYYIFLNKKLTPINRQLYKIMGSENTPIKSKERQGLKTHKQI